MKRKNKKRRLQLSKSTVRTLRPPDLGPVQGGGYGFTCNRNNCGNSAECEVK